MAWGSRRRELFEYWGHNASLLPLGTYPLLKWRMEAATRWDWDGWAARTKPNRVVPDDWKSTLDPAIQAPWAVIEGMTRLTRERPGLVEEVLAVVAERGPVAAGEASPDGRRRGGPTAEGGRMWNWQDAKIALEWLFCTGRVTTATRRNFERLYDLTERVLPTDALAAPVPSQDDAQRELVRIAARANGIATERQLREYFRLPAEQGKARIAELVEAGELTPVRIEGQPQRMYLWPGARVPARASSTSTTGSASTPGPRNGPTATTCCRSYSATGWWLGSTSRPTVDSRRCSSRRPTPSRRCARPTSWPSWQRSCA
jgi:uncharacterized protein YcaQ